MPKKTAKAKAAPKSSLKDRLLEAALPDVAFDGWSEELLARAQKKLGLDDDAVNEALPGGVADLVAHFSLWADARMLAKLPAKKLAELRIRDRVALCVRTRLEVLAPHKQAVASALSFCAPPPRSLQLPKAVWQTADAIWRACGDTSTDYNHYTKRILLSGVLTSTALYWLNDRSEGHEKSWAFLGRRIDNVLKLGMVIGKLKPKKDADKNDAGTKGAHK